LLQELLPFYTCVHDFCFPLSYQYLEIQLESHEQYTEIFWACQFAGLVPCVLTPLTQDHNQRVAHLTHLSKLLAPKVITTSHLAQDLSVVPELDVLEVSSLAFLDLAVLPELFVSPDDISCLMLTSGSTGNAKAVELTHRNILSAVMGKSVYHGTDFTSVFFNASIVYAISYKVTI
jgi:acyl-CoA synthetase (AMP-forming)/AMP-acid ligase II